MIAGSSISQFRAHPLDGARLYFDRSTGTHVRLEGPAYAESIRGAPRVVQLGLTNRCNLRCAFCFRERGLASTWTAAEILAWAKQLAEFGVLELGFGQGEPLVFPGFPALVRALARETPLAINFTTNGLRLDDATLDELEGMPGQLRLSYYDGDDNHNDPLVRVRSLARRGLRFGVNLLVTPERLPSLHDTVEALVGGGCRDLLLLAYNGPDRALHLSPAEDRRLAQIVLAAHAAQGSTLAIGLSVCFGRRLFEVPQLPVHGLADDCGAGDDFVTIDSEKRLLACSFHGAATPVDSPAQAIALWQARRARRAPAGIEGCARPGLPLARASPPAAGVGRPSTEPRVWVWQAFASNHSTSYTLVGEFSTAAKSAAYVAAIEALIERCAARPRHEYPPLNLWQALGRTGEPEAKAWLASARDLAEGRPETILVGGRRVLVHADSTLHRFEIFAHQLLRQHGRITRSDGRWGTDIALVFGVEAGDASEAIAGTLAGLCEQWRVRGSRCYGIVESQKIERAAAILRALPRSIAAVHFTDETLASAFDDPPPLPSRKRGVEWTLIERMPIDEWRRSIADFRADPIARLAACDWHHPFRMPERLDGYPLLGHTIVRSEGAGFPAALQAWLAGHYLQIVSGPRLRLRLVRRSYDRDELEPPFRGLLPEHVAALSRPGGSFEIRSFQAAIDVLPHNPVATFAQVQAILGGLDYIAIDIMPERPLADALARIDEDLDAARSP